MPVRAGTWWRLLRRAVVTLLASCGTLLLAVLFTPLADWIIGPLLVRADRSPTDAIVLLTAWASHDEVLNDPGLRRTIEAARLYHAGVARTVVVSGRNRSASGPTAAVMAKLLEELQVPAAAVVLETDSTTTHESAVNVARLARERGWRNVTVVSDAIDMRRVLASFRREGVTAHAGADARIAMRAPPGFYRLWQLEGAVHEWAGLLYYWWMDWV